MVQQIDDGSQNLQINGNLIIHVDRSSLVILLTSLLASSLVELLLNFLPLFVASSPASPLAPAAHALYHYLNLCADFIQFALIYLILRLLSFSSFISRQLPINAAKVAFSSLLTRITTYLNLHVPLYLVGGH